eukprot:m.107206 g.107206  ORF g.107206 m.107206 type:complete len:133 (-) comp15175_c0_seq2:1072-1470(-)
MTSKAKTFFIGGNNGVALIADPLLERGWKKVDDADSSDFTLKWVESRKQINFKAFRPGITPYCTQRQQAARTRKTPQSALISAPRYWLISSMAVCSYFSHHFFFSLSLFFTIKASNYWHATPIYLCWLPKQN